MTWEERLPYQFVEWNPYNPRHPMGRNPQSILVKSLLRFENYYWISCGNPEKALADLGISATHGYTLKHKPFYPRDRTIGPPPVWGPPSSATDGHRDTEQPSSAKAESSRSNKSELGSESRATENGKRAASPEQEERRVRPGQPRKLELRLKKTKPSSKEKEGAGADEKG